MRIGAAPGRLLAETGETNFYVEILRIVLRDLGKVLLRRDGITGAVVKIAEHVPLEQVMCLHLARLASVGHDSDGGLHVSPVGVRHRRRHPAFGHHRRMRRMLFHLGPQLLDDFIALQRPVAVAQHGHIGHVGSVARAREFQVFRCGLPVLRAVLQPSSQHANIVDEPKIFKNGLQHSKCLAIPLGVVRHKSSRQLATHVVEATITDRLADLARQRLFERWGRGKR